VPKEIKSVNELLWLMKYKYGVEIAGAFGPLAGKAFRIGHLGFVRGWDVISTISALESSLRELGYPLDEKIDRSVPDEITPVAAAQKVFIYAPEEIAYTKNHVSMSGRS
jgi:aspartate aminotransferase-like enzyme